MNTVEIKIVHALTYSENHAQVEMSHSVRDFKVSLWKLRNRRASRLSASAKGGHDKKLSELQDHTIKEYLLMVHMAGTSRTTDVL